MDLNFFRRAYRDSAVRSAGLDYGVLTAALQAFQAASVTARIQAQPLSREEVPNLPQESLVELLLGGPAWREAVNQQGGSFNPHWARGRSGHG